MAPTSRQRDRVSGSSGWRAGPLRWWRLAVALLIALGLAGLAPLSAHQADAAEVGPSRVYFPQTGHELADEFLDYWRHSGAIPVFGYPVSEEFTDAASGLILQYFERAVFEWHPEASPNWRVQLQRIGAAATAGRGDEAAFRPLVAGNDANTTFFPQTGHRLSFGFRAYWERQGGLPVFGYPLSEEFSEGGYTVQYFERARFEWHPEHRGTPYEILLGLLGTAAADRAGVDRAPLPQRAGIPAYDPGLWRLAEPAPPPLSGRVAPPGAPSQQAKWIEVDLSEQHLWAWTRTTVVMDSAVSTGAADYPTVTGTFAVYLKLVTDDMEGGTPGVDYYFTPDVPWVMYFYRGYALHGAYWHNDFGRPRSHGCVNLPMAAAEWLYGWTPLGTTVWVHP